MIMMIVVTNANDLYNKCLLDKFGDTDVLWRILNNKEKLSTINFK